MMMMMIWTQKTCGECNQITMKNERKKDDAPFHGHDVSISID